MSQNILIIDDERNIRRTLDMILSGEGYQVFTCASAQAGLGVLQKERIHLVLLDIVMPEVNGLDVLPELLKVRSDLAVIMISGHGNVQNAVLAIKRGAYDFLEKPLDRDKVLLAISRALQTRKLAAENRHLKQQIEGRYEMVGQSPALSEIRNQIARVAPTNGRVLILGESGTGKELVARAVHKMSHRAKNSFVKVNCAAIPEELIESELFGSDRGAFTGAVKTRDGKFLQADGGTLFLDEIGDMSLSVQAKVLRALEQGEFERVGGAKTFRVDVRVIAATNKNLHAEVEQGKFREDLYFRLNVVPLTAPPLRERREDIPELAEHFLNAYAEENGFLPKALSAEARDLLLQYDWPGNIRELKNLVERLSIMVSGDTIYPEDLPTLDGMSIPKQPDSFPDLGAGKTLRQVREAVERHYIAEALERHKGNVTRASNALGIERTNLHKKIKQYDLER
ncbi:MAG: sigma-54 dependent transcriptional regulator [Gemmatimonadota bacterium]|nr:sigma-54 dependent transcriptional regulator [Gemmatimonadota bacterium]MDE2829525.1 sigma-54 dependent transcriptional regulator [Gemmatimonadota bacterium]